MTALYQLLPIIWNLTSEPSHDSPLRETGSYYQYISGNSPEWHIMIFRDPMYPGVVNQAVMLSLGTLGALLLAYCSGLNKPTENFKLRITAATEGIAFIYMSSFVLVFFNIQVPVMHSNSNMGILFILGVAVTLIWLYVELLRLLPKLQLRRK